MNVRDETITIFGGTGFVGRYIVQRLARAGYRVKVATRAPERAYFLQPYGGVGQIVPFACDYHDAASITKAVRGSVAVINCVGILNQKRRNKFERVHAEIPHTISFACKHEGVRRLIHISAIGADNGTSEYARSKHDGEQAVRKNFPSATILRPSIVFGQEDRFFNMFAHLARFLPFLPLIGGGRTRFQPVYVGDVAEAAMQALRNPEAAGKTYELGGPEIVDFREVYERIFSHTGRRRALIKLPYAVAKAQASVLGLLPRPLLTRDQVESLKTDNVVGDGTLTLSSLGIKPVAMNLVLASYLDYYRPGGGFADKKRA